MSIAPTRLKCLRYFTLGLLGCGFGLLAGSEALAQTPTESEKIGLDEIKIAANARNTSAATTLLTHETSEARALPATPSIARDSLAQRHANPTFERAVDFHGFFDLEYEVDNRDRDGKIGDFDVHHFNVISTFKFSPRAMVLGEIEYEHGIEHESGTTVGLIALERAWLRLQIDKKLNLSFGKFLTPYGIYNTVHDASPTFLFTKLPYSLYDRHLNASGKSERDYPKFFAGVQANGLLPFAAGELEYFAYYGNGKGSKPYEKDDNPNKAIGLRLRYLESLERIKLGASWFRGQNGNDAHTMQQILASDLEWNQGPLQVQIEGTWNRFERLVNGAKNGAHRRAFGYYAQTSVKLFGRLRPFARYDAYDPDHQGSSDVERTIALGLNLGIYKDVFLKFENHFRSSQAPSYKEHELFVASIAAGF